RRCGCFHPKIGDISEPVGVELLNEPHPCSLNQIPKQFVKGPKAVHDAVLQSDAAATIQVLVEKVQALYSHGLQLPNVHCANDLIDFRNQFWPTIRGDLLEPEEG